MLDIDWGKQPFTTSSSCDISSVFKCGVSYKKIRKVYGIAKIYETYVGKMEYQGEGEDLVKLGDIGKEFGATTGRRRQCNWLNLDTLNMAITINGITDLIVNKCDIIKILGIYKLIHNESIIEFKSFEEMIEYINKNITDKNINITYSYRKDAI